MSELPVHLPPQPSSAVHAYGHMSKNTRLSLLSILQACGGLQTWDHYSFQGLPLCMTSAEGIWIGFPAYRQVVLFDLFLSQSKCSPHQLLSNGRVRLHLTTLSYQILEVLFVWCLIFGSSVSNWWSGICLRYTLGGGVLKFFLGMFLFLHKYFMQTFSASIR